MRKIILGIVIMLSLNLVAQVNVTQLGKLSYNNNLNDVWGTKINGTEYALVGVTTGLSVVDISTPSNPTEVFFKAGANSTWRDIKTWNNHAYVTNESAGGLLIVDLNTLPGNTNLTTTTYTGTNYSWSTAHNLYIDENGICYIFGTNYSTGGVILLDLTQDPKNPVELGTWNEHYLHDGVARGDTMWGSAVLSGIQLAVDVSNKSNPSTMTSWSTPHNFTHNNWFSDNGKNIFTTDEISDAYVAAYDVSNFNNIIETDRIQSSPGQNVIPHNTHVLNDYLITSYYRDGVQIVDAARPHNIIEVGNFDTSPSFSGNGFNGCWGAYPWLPSGNILATDIEEGLYILGPTYQRACYVEGSIVDSVCGGNIINAQLEIMGTGITTTSDILGTFAFGTVLSGTYSIQITKTGYTTKVINNVSLANGQLTNLNILMSANGSGIQFTGTITDASGTPLPNVKVHIQNGTYSSTNETDNQGNFKDCNVIAGSYDIAISKWGYKTVCFQNHVINSSNSTLSQSLSTGYEDDFSNDLGWTVSSVASTGIWTRGEPDGTFNNSTAINPDNDATGDCLDKAYMTGNGGGSQGDDDVDDGTTTASSPIMDLSSYNDPYVTYSSWFYASNQSGQGTDYYKIQINNGNTTATIEDFGTNSNNMSQWNAKQFRIADFIAVTATMRFILEAADVGTGDIVEAAIDNIMIFDSAGGSGLPPVAAMNNSSNSICVGSQVNFTDNSSNSPTSWNWSFPGGTPSSSTNQNPSVSYASVGSYNVTLSVTNTNGTDATTSTGLISVSAVPSASYSTSTNGLAMSFTNQSTNATSWSWSFGDGNTSNTQNSTNTYSSAGNYTVCLISGNAGCPSDTSCTTVNVSSSGVAPQANFNTTNTTNVCEGQTVTFIDQSINSPTTWEWTFQGGTPATSNQQNPTITYNNSGVYNVKLKAINGAGADSLTQQSYVMVDAKPLGSFTYTVNGLTVTFSDNSTNTTSWLWGFGDGIFNTNQSPVHSYTSNGTYTVCVTVENDNSNCPDDVVCETITLSPNSIGEFQREYLKLYPNPVQNEFIISGFKNNQARQYKIFDTYGKLVQTDGLNIQNGQAGCNIENLSPGVYVFTLGQFRISVIRLD